MVERCLAKADIAGPNPVSRSMPRYRKIARLFLYTGIRTRGFASTRKASSSRSRCVSVDVRQRGFFYTRGFGPAALQVRGGRPHPAPALPHCRNCGMQGLFLRRGIRTRGFASTRKISSQQVSNRCSGGGSWNATVLFGSMMFVVDTRLLRRTCAGQNDIFLPLTIKKNLLGLKK